MTLADLISPGSGRVRLHFPDEDISIDYGGLWKKAEVVRRLRLASAGEPVAIALSNSSACATVLVGAIAAGQPLLSVPMPPRGADLEWYSQFVQNICTVSGATTLLVDSALLPLLPPVAGINFLSFDDVLALRGPGVTEPTSFVFTQFTSGSTADPKGVVLSGDKIVANLRAILEWMQPVQGDGVCTWLPLSHDMGLIGMFLCSLAGSSAKWVRSAEHVFMTPQGFLRNPGRWLAACERYGSTITAAPNYGYDMAARRPGPVHDLRHLRVCIAGGEPIRASSLERFSEVFARTGFDSRAFCPAYGMAEAAVAVTGTSAGDHWHAAEFEPVSGNTRGVTAGAQPTQVVSSGKPLPGYQVRVDGSGIGEILVRGPSVADAYADGTPLTDSAGWFPTRDLGVLRNGELYVLGRTDDVLFVSGRNIYALDVEAHANDVTGVRTGRVVAVPENGALTLVAECEPTYCDQASASRLARELRQRIVARTGVAPRRVLLTRRGALPMTSSGKVRRRPLAAALQSSQLKILDGSLDS